MSQRYLGGVITANPTTPTMTTESGVWTLEQQFQYSSVWSPKIVGNSVRLRNSASGYFSRTYSTSPTNSRINTFSGWVKRGTLGSLGYLFTAYDGSSALAAGIWFQNDKLWAEYGGPSGSGRITTTAVYRDPSAWYHIVLSINTTQATASDRVKLYVNGVQVTAFDTATNPTFNLATAFTFPNGNNRVGANWDNSGPFDGYMAEVNFIDGQALTPSSFGAFDSTGVWQPLLYTGTYGTNGFYLTFSDNSAATAAALGKDTSGNGNNWTPNNVSLTAGSTYDWMLDSPTNWTSGTGNGVGNYAVMNPLTAKSGYASTTDGNLRANFTSGANASFVIGNTFQSSGKWYCEAQIVSTGADATRPCVGIVKSSFDWNSIAINLGDTSDSWAYLKNGNKRTASTTSSYGSSYTAGDIIGIALDMDAGTVVFYKNNVSQGTAFTGLSGDIALATSGFADGATRAIDVNFGQRPFSYTPPTGFKALNTLNLPDPTIMNGASYMAATTYTGNGGTQTVANSGGFAPDFVWIKNRGTITDHGLFDTVRGATKRLASNLTTAETTEVNSLTAFTSTGFTVGATQDFNQNGVGLVGWQWLAGRGTTSSNTAGSITSTTSVSTTAGFSVVTYTGTGSSGATVGHGLGVAPRMMIVKGRGSVNNWSVYHASLGNAQTVYLNLTQAASSGSTTSWNSTTPSSTTFTVGPDNAVNQSGINLVAYCFAQVAGYSAFGSYTGNGSTDGPFVFTGFRPRYVLYKRTDAIADWRVFDSARDTYNVGNAQLIPNVSNAETTSTATSGIDFLSNGFKLRNADGYGNANGGTYIYACFAENPFKIARAR